MADASTGHSVLVIGGGIAGIRAALDLSAVGYAVHLVEAKPAIGGAAARLDRSYPLNEAAFCALGPMLCDVASAPNVEILCNAEVAAVQGRAGDFTVAIRKRPAYVDAKKCTLCRMCTAVCPVSAPNEFDGGRSERKAIYEMYPSCIPQTVTIDPQTCKRFLTNDCDACQGACPEGAVDFSQQEESIERKVGAIVVATGADVFHPRLYAEYGYGRWPNVVTSIEFERWLHPAGPTQGAIVRPSDGKPPKSIAFIQCVGSRELTGKGSLHCSSVCCATSTKHALAAKARVPRVEVAIYSLDHRSQGLAGESCYLRAREEGRVSYIWSLPSSVVASHGGSLTVRAVDAEGKAVAKSYDLVVLACGLRPSQAGAGLAAILGCDCDEYGFIASLPHCPVGTSKPGVFVCGTAGGPKTISASVIEASAAAARVQSLLVSPPVAPAEPPDPAGPGPDEKLRVGVFMCQCGGTVSAGMSLDDVREFAGRQKDVLHAERLTFGCAPDGARRIARAIREKGLNRIVVAACSPRTHEALFHAALREAGLNPRLMEMINIREQCALTHIRHPDAAADKAKRLITGAIQKAKLLRPFSAKKTPRDGQAVVIGGGPAGMSAALALSAFGFPVRLVEKSEGLGGHLAQMRSDIWGNETASLLQDMVNAINAAAGITVHVQTELVGVTGWAGGFMCRLKSGDREETVSAGAIVLATGAGEFREAKLLKIPIKGVLTQSELEGRIEAGTTGLAAGDSVVMFQCIGSRDAERPYCSEICCAQAIKNALRITEQTPGVKVFVLHKDIRIPGLYERMYLQARRRGVAFIRHLERQPPQASGDGQLTVSFWDPVIKDKVTLHPKLLVLSTGLVPSNDAPALAQETKTLVDGSGFFLCEHDALRPVDSMTAGVLVCGAARGPKFLHEAMAEGSAAGARAAGLLLAGVGAAAATAVVDPELCTLCLHCVRVCPFHAPQAGEETVTIDAVLCKGCGTCGAECPAKAIHVERFRDDQLEAQIAELVQR